MNTFDYNIFAAVMRPLNSNWLAVPRIACVDGFNISVQSGTGLYCLPIINKYEEMDDDVIFTHVEAGFPSEPEPLLNEFQHDDGDPTKSVYGRVPIDIISAVVKKHGGLNPLLLVKYLKRKKAKEAK